MDDFLQFFQTWVFLTVLLAILGCVGYLIYRYFSGNLKPIEIVECGAMFFWYVIFISLVACVVFIIYLVFQAVNYELGTERLYQPICESMLVDNCEAYVEWVAPYIDKMDECVNTTRSSYQSTTSALIGCLEWA
jgi:hypothetical protein